jgi:Uma2 family endonuclease
MRHAQAIDKTPMSEREFLAWAEPLDERYELVEGVPMMQAGATRGHERVAKRVFVALLRQVDAARLDVNKGDFGVRIRPGNKAGSVLLPDVLVDLQSDDASERVTETPVVVVEVLSESTDYAHHVAKLALYRLRPSLRQYVVFEQRTPKAYVWEVQDGEWPREPRVVEGMEAVVTFPEIGARVGLGEVYR